jgi:hypothetical protein
MDAVPAFGGLVPVGFRRLGRTVDGLFDFGRASQAVSQQRIFGQAAGAHKSKPAVKPVRLLADHCGDGWHGKLLGSGAGVHPAIVRGVGKKWSCHKKNSFTRG